MGLTSLIRVIGSGIGGLLKGAGIGTICESVVYNKPVMDALTDEKTMYFAGAIALGTALYRLKEELFDREEDTLYLER